MVETGRTSSRRSSPSAFSASTTCEKPEVSQAPSSTTATDTGSTLWEFLRLENMKMNIVERMMGKSKVQIHMLGLRAFARMVAFIVDSITTS